MAKRKNYPYTFTDVQETAEEFKRQLKVKDAKPLAQTAIVLGSGLGGFVKKLGKKYKVKSVAYSDIKNFPKTSVDGHDGQLSLATHKTRSLLVMQGRFHCYEGYAAPWVAFPIRVLSALGVKKFILTNASGGIGHELNVGDLMLISDHLNMTGTSPLLGPNDLRFGPRFLDMTTTYSKDLRSDAKSIARDMGFELKEGVYTGVLGPCYETPAEIEMFRKLGGHAVGMSTIFESIAARHGGGEVLGIACITNKAAGMTGELLSHDEVKENAKSMENKLSQLLLKLVEL